MSSRALRALVPLSLLAPSFAACRSSPPQPVPLAGDASQLAGEWSGSYQSPATGRSGSIVFTFTAGETSARGDVVMVPVGNNGPLRPMPGQVAERDTSRAPQVLTIDFVRAAGDSLTGTMAPYLDPDCNCSTVAVFRGRIAGDVISGTFTATQQSGRSANGTWQIRRRR